jgi:hypothetical protein
MATQATTWCWTRRAPTRRPVRGLALLLLLGLAIACHAGARPREEEVWLRGTGPYRGRVVDAATQQPIAGAVVVAVWDYEVSLVVDQTTRIHDVLEVVTDAQGAFVVDAPDIERRAPRATLFPVFKIFKPGYRYFNGWFASTDAMADRQNRTLLGTVELKLFTNRKDRLDHQPVESDLQVDYRAKVPLFLKALAEERKALGLGN